ncbi:rhamnogalacturonase A precursor [Aspergillus vadensis CBS 113365]|uniref:Rhamnogalacturonase A n=1 Tax=Aspergillus vadensis (strain CBS 113365 / IMI 142717 / IBT 24658) TaxID=1448311 RepID=A0A319BCR9_ASPVC|nr:rhamnogalacturonase A precursor [Aspergillus vadensis CBS 113365]PYH70896.1 rhamnogalacturonase A precursor [Aspergillus vadensis CBS 113365]
MRASILPYTLFLATLARAQLSGPVGPLVDYSTKAKNQTCNIIDYGALADGKTDISQPLLDAWGNCSVGGLVYIPPGNYSLAEDIELKHGQSSAIQLDGVIMRGHRGSYQMILIRDCNDFEFFSGNSRGAIQGFGYEYLQNDTYGERLLRIQEVSNFSVHGFALVDSPSYYIVLDTVSSGEVYNILIRGVTSVGATDAIDVWGENMWFHDIEVSNGDECVTVKSPAHNYLIENIYCNLSGGTAIGSLGTGTNISDIHYRNLYMNRADACFLKSNNGDGIIKNIIWENVIVHGGPYPLAIDEAWGDDRGSGGVQVSNLTFRNWHGESASASRPVIRLQCDSDVPCYDITIENVNLWANDSSDVVWLCENAYGDGACLSSGKGTTDLKTFTSKQTITATPSYAAPTMAADFTADLPSTRPFTIPPMPTSFYPGATPISTLLHLHGAGGLPSASPVSHHRRRH